MMPRIPLLYGEHPVGSAKVNDHVGALMVVAEFMAAAADCFAASSSDFAASYVVPTLCGVPVSSIFTAGDGSTPAEEVTDAVVPGVVVTEVLCDPSGFVVVVIDCLPGLVTVCFFSTPIVT